MPSRNRKKRSKQRAEYLQKQDDILSQENKAKARARYKADPEKKKASVRQGRSRKEEGLCTTRPIPKRRRPLYDKADPEKKKASVRQGRSRKEEGLCTQQLQGRSRKEEGLCTRQLQGRSRKEEGLCTRQLQGRSEKKKASVRDSYKADPKRRRPLYATATTQILNLSNLLKGSDIKRTSRRTVLLKGSDIKRTSRRTALLKGRNTRTIQLPLRHLKGIGIGMNPLSDWLNVLPRGSGIAGVTELPLPPKGMSWHVVLH